MSRCAWAASVYYSITEYEKAKSEGKNTQWAKNNPSKWDIVSFVKGLQRDLRKGKPIPGVNC